MPTAIAHEPPFTVPGSSTSTALVRWNGTGGNQIQDSTILVGATTMGLAADTDLVTFSNGTLTIAGTVAATTLTGAGSGITALNGSNIASGTVPVARLSAASTTASGIAELATTAETNTGSDTGRTVTPDGLAGSVHGEKVIQTLVDLMRLHDGHVDGGEQRDRPADALARQQHAGAGLRHRVVDAGDAELCPGHLAT